MKLFSKISGEGPHLIIMHGVFGMGDNWQSLSRKWSEHYTVHQLDMRNHGRSPHSDDFSYNVMSDDLVEYFNDHNIEKAHVLGHSMGGKVAMLFAVLNPKMVDQLIIADIAPKEYQPHHQKILEALNALDLENINGRTEAQDAFEKLLDDAGTRMFLLKSLYYKNKEQLDWRFNLPVITREIVKVNEGLPDNAIYHGNVLFLRGNKSKYIQDEDLEQIESHFPDYTLETIKDAGHWLHAEQPQAFYDLVGTFLEN